jgi:hypothetical protein
MAKIRIGQRWKARNGAEVVLLKKALLAEDGHTYLEADNGMVYRDHVSSANGKVKHVFSSLNENQWDLVEILGNY